MINMENSNCCDSENVCECGCKCSGDRSNKLCMLTKPKNKFNVDKIKKLTNNPKFICTCCGRLANKKENLCSPVPLKD